MLKLGHAYSAGGNVKRCSHSGKDCGISYKIKHMLTIQPQASSKFKTFALSKNLWKGWKHKLHTGKYLQTTYPRKTLYLEYIKISQNSKE